MRSFAFALLAAGSALVAAPAIAQTGTGPFSGARVEGTVGWDRVQNNGHNDDVTYGVGAGYDWNSNGTVFGIDGEISDSNVKQCSGARTAADPRFCAKVARDLYVGGRIGKQVGDRALVYAKAGYTNARAKLTADDGSDEVTLDKVDLDGVRVGAGAEYAVGPNSFVKAEYRYSNYEQGFTRHQVLGGFGFRF